LANYRFGFNGQESDNEVYGDKQSYNFEFRMLDARLGRFWSVDPLADKYPGLSPYAYCNNSPVNLIDPDGNAPIPSWAWLSNGVRILSVKGNIGAENIKIKESISLSKDESEKAGQISQWSGFSSSTLKQDKDGNSYFEGTVMSRGLFGKAKKTGINVTSPTVKPDNGYAPSEIWMSKEYKNSLNSK
jgi:RHS repeat-associated protein